MSEHQDHTYVSRGGLKLAAALDAFGLDPAGWVCADLGCNVGGFVDCLLRRGATRVYAIDTGYGSLAWSLRSDPRVVVMERTNAMHVTLGESVDLVTIDVGWTRQHHVLPNALRMLKPDGHIITLIKPHYEVEPRQLRRGVLPNELARQSLNLVLERISAIGAVVQRCMDSPVPGRKGNLEFLALLSADKSALQGEQPNP